LVFFDWHPGGVGGAIDSALTNEAALGELAERGRAFALEHHDPDVHFDRMLRTIDEFLGRAGG
jgi:hypothetical protein